ncbi:hypothetical protein Tco_1036572 [Tanacetum coccineum]
MTTLESCNKHNIVNWEYILLGMTEAKDSEVCKITKADGTSSFHGDFQALLRRLDRQDLFQLYNLVQEQDLFQLYSLVQERFKHHPLEGHDLDLLGDLRIIFDPNEEDDIWLNQQYWELLRWKLHEYSGVHSLFLDGTSIHINMLVDKKYPLKKEILKKMINLKIEAEEESYMAHELIKFIKSQIAKQTKQKIHSIGINTESSKDSEAEFLTPLPPLKILQGASPSSEAQAYLKATTEDHRTSDHEMYTASLKRSKNYKAQPYQYASSSKQILRAKAKTLPPCTHYGFNDHIPDDCRNYPECGIYGSYDHSTSGHNRVIQIRGGLLVSPLNLMSPQLG